MQNRAFSHLRFLFVLPAKIIYNQVLCRSRESGNLRSGLIEVLIFEGIINMTENDDILEEIIAFAIDNEIEAYHFYTDLAAKAGNPEMKNVLLDFATEEQGHRKMLDDFRKGKKVALGGEKIPDLKIADYAVDIQPTENMKYQDILTLAMKKEKAAFMLYTDLADSVDSPEAKQLFTVLAQQEAKHKLRFELEYDNVVLKED